MTTLLFLKVFLVRFCCDHDETSTT